MAGPNAATQQPFACDEPGCDASFTLARGLTRHKHETHGYPKSKKTRPQGRQLDVDPLDEDSVTFQVAARLRELSLPLREEKQKIERRLVEIRRERADLDTALRRIEKTLAGLEGTKAPAKGAPDTGRVTDVTKRKAVEQFLSEFEYPDGFTNADLDRDLKANGVTPVMSPQKVRDILRQLHSEGSVRADRIVKGGGQLYMLVGVNGGANAE